METITAYRFQGFDFFRAPVAGAEEVTLTVADGVKIVEDELGVKRVYTDLAVIDVTSSGMVVREMLGGLGEADLRARTGAPLTFAPDRRPLVAPAIALPD